MNEKNREIRYNTHRMVTIIGLGNPGNEYRDTRHNIGWLTLSAWGERHGLPSFAQSSRYTALISEGEINGTVVNIVLPTGYMNNSGVSVARHIKERGSSDNFIVVHDDIDLPFGVVRVSYDRGAGGHNGVQSIIDSCATKQFARVRVGIAQKSFFGVLQRPSGEALSAFVLGKFTKSEHAQLTEIHKKVDTALMLIIEKGVESAMQEVNGV